MQANLFIAKGAINIEVIKNLLYFVCDDKRGDKLSSRVNNLSKRETFSTVFF